MFSKVVNRKNDVVDISQVGVGVLFEIVSSPLKDQHGLICVKTFSNIVCLVGNGISPYKPFQSTWDNPNSIWKVRILTNEQVILSNTEIK